MKTVKKAKENSKLWNAILSLCEVSIGILLLIKPVEFTYGVMTFLGIILCTVGVIDMVQYFRSDPVSAALRHDLARGLLSILLGAFFLLKKAWVVKAFPLLTVLYGVMMLVTGIYKLQWMADMLRARMKKWYWPAISAALTLAFACLVLSNPFGSTAVLWKCTAIFLMIEAVIDLLATLFIKEEEAH